MTTWCDEMPAMPEPRSEKKIFVASFNRASNGAVSKLCAALRSNNMEAHVVHDKWDYILACGDRKETFEFCLKHYGKIPIIHLWAGEISQGTHDEIYRWAITQMSVMQLCTNEDAAYRVKLFFKKVFGRPATNVHVVGNVMLDNMPSLEYDVVLYNPPTHGSLVASVNEIIERECDKIGTMLDKTYFWIPPNGDAGSSDIDRFVNTPGLSRPQFLALVKNCRKFISNSSCIDYEAKHIIKPEQIIRIGERNKERSSKVEDMGIKNATRNIMQLLKEL